MEDCPKCEHTRIRRNTEILKLQQIATPLNLRWCPLQEEFNWIQVNISVNYIRILYEQFVIIGRLHLMSMDDTVLRAEILWALKCVKSTFSFASNTGNNDLFTAMFPDSKIAKSYKTSETKCKYLIQFGVCPWILEDLKEDFKGSPFAYLFDETTTIQVKNQYDAYVRFESERHGKIVDSYCGSLFLGHCNADHLVTNFCEFGKRMDW